MTKRKTRLQPFIKPRSTVSHGKNHHEPSFDTAATVLTSLDSNNREAAPRATGGLLRTRTHATAFTLQATHTFLFPFGSHLYNAKVSTYRQGGWVG